MSTKDKIGVLVLIGGIGLIGAYWFNKKKKAVSSTQAKQLNALSNVYTSGIGVDKSFVPSNVKPSNIKVGDFTSMTPQEIRDFNNQNFGIPNFIDTTIANNLSQSLKNMDFGNLDLSKIKIQ